MFKMSVLWLLIYFGGLLLSFVNPAFGLATYLFEYYLRPTLHWWGVPLPDWRWNLIVSVVLGVTYLLRRATLPSLPDHRSTVLRWLLGLTAIVFLVSVTVALDTTTSLNQAGHFVKFVIICVLITGILRTEWALNLFVTVHVLGAAWWGWEAYSAPKRIAGRLINVGSG